MPQSGALQPVALWPLYAATLACSMGMMGYLAVAGPLADLLGLNALQMGISATAGGLGWAMASRPWGRVSDRRGRRPVLMAGLAGFAAFFVALCLVVHAGAAWGLAPLVAWAGMTLARLAMGVAYAAVPASANAMVADAFAPRDRAGAMGRLGAAQAAGLLLGPAFVALAAGPQPVLPLFLLALLPVLALAAAARLTEPGTGAGAALPEPLAIADPRLRLPLTAALAAMSAVGISIIIVGFVGIDRLEMTREGATRLAGVALATVGLALVAAQMAIRPLGWPPARLMIIGSTVATAGFAVSAVAPTGWALVAGYGLAGLGMGWVFPAVQALAANAVGPGQQGQAAGTVSMALGIGQAVGPLIGGAVYVVAGGWALGLGAALALIPAALGLRLRARG